MPDERVIAVLADLERDDRIDPAALEEVRLPHILADDVIQDFRTRSHFGQDLARAAMGLVSVRTREGLG